MEPQHLVTQEGGEEALQWRQWVWIIYRHRWLVIGTTLISLLFASLYLKVTPPIYEAVSLVRVRSQDNSGERVSPLPLMGTRSGSIALKTVTRLITTQLTAQEALKILREQDWPSPHLTMEEVLKWVRAKPIEPDLVEIVVRHPEPKVAMVIANAFAEAITKRLTSDSRIEASQERRFIEKSLHALERRLAELEQRLVKEKEELGIVDIIKETESLVNALQTAEKELQEAQSEWEIAHRVAERLALKFPDKKPLTTVTLFKENPILRRMEEELAELELERANLLARYTSKHFSLRRVEGRIKNLRDALSKRVKEFVKKGVEVAPDPSYALLQERLLEAEMRALASKARIEALREVIKKLRQDLSALPEKQRRIGELLRKVKATEQVYLNLLMRLEDVRVREAARLGSVLVADLAVLPRRPISPRKSLILLVSFVLGSFLGLTSAFFLGLWNDSVETPEEVRRLVNGDVLATIPHANDQRIIQDPIALMTARHPCADAIRLLRTNLKFLGGDHSLRCLLITSAVPGEGKSFVALTLAIAFAQGGQRTILVDADLRLPQLHKRLSAAAQKGLADLLFNSLPLEEVLQETKVQNLRFLPAGSLPPDPATALESPRLPGIIKALREWADLVIIDAPPLLPFPDTLLLISHCDGTLVVVEAGQTPRSALLKLQEQIQRSRGHIFGFVLNKVSPQMGGGYYRYHTHIHRHYAGYYRGD